MDGRGYRVNHTQGRRPSCQLSTSGILPWGAPGLEVVGKMRENRECGFVPVCEDKMDEAEWCLYTSCGLYDD